MKGRQYRCWVCQRWVENLHPVPVEISGVRLPIRALVCFECAAVIEKYDAELASPQEGES
jgi:hypothetical protein